MGPGEASLYESTLYPWAPKCGIRHPVEAGAEAQEMEDAPWDGAVDLEEVWPAEVDLFASQENSHCPLWFFPHSSSSSGTGRHGTALVEALGVCINKY